MIGARTAPEIAGLSYRFLTGETGVEPVAKTAQDPDRAAVAVGELGAVVAPERTRPA